jgi:hypothetical protein
MNVKDRVEGWNGTLLAAGSTGPDPLQFNPGHTDCQCNIHRSVSDSTGDWEYADASVRDMARFGFLVLAPGLIVIVFAGGPLAPATA